MNKSNPSVDVLIIGAGFAGLTCARELAERGLKILVLEKRNHIGGNAHDELDEHGVLIHPYGPHIFHTNSKRVFAWLSQFTEWRFYEHRVLASADGQLLPLPINRTTLNRLYGLNLSEEEAAAYLESVREPVNEIRTSEDVVLNAVGHDLCNKFFKGYTRKQWNLDLRELSAGVAARIPTRTNDDDRYFTDQFQFMPAQGYGRMFSRMADHPGISIQLETDFDVLSCAIQRRHTIYTGPVDAYFCHQLGRLPYRSLRFEHQHLPDTQQHQPCGTINYPNEHEYTRITEFRHLTGQKGLGTSIVREYPCDSGDPYYPIPRSENEALNERYRALAEKEKDVSFVGRLAQYRYYNMDQVVAASLKLCDTLKHHL